MMTPAQCRAARGLLDWSQQQLADAARVSNATIRNYEAGKTTPQNSTIDVMRRAMEGAGVIFRLDDDADCVCLKRAAGS
jgi:transcriptional regulator with XRE-family HTH domain